MKKMYVVSAFVGMSLCMASVAVAFDGASLTSQTTMEMYDDVDPYDHSLDTALLYNIERWRLYTNASAYEDGNSYLLGTSGKLGPGSLSLFFETTTSEDLETDYDTSLFQMEVEDPLAVLYTNPYDGVFDYISQGADHAVDNSDSDEDEYYVSYGMDIVPGVFSLGLAINPSSEESSWDESETTTGSTTDYTAGVPGHLIYDTNVTYDGSTWYGESESDELVIPVGAHWRPTPDFALRAYVAYMDEEDDSKYGSSSLDTTTIDQVGAGAFADGYQYRENDNDTYTYKSQDDLDGWGIELIPTFRINPNLMIRCDLGYSNKDGDSDSSYREYDTYIQSTKASASEPTIIATDTEYERTGALSGDAEETSYKISPRLYFTYGAAQFSLGVTYEKEEDQNDGSSVAGGQSSLISRSYDAVTGALTEWTEAITENNSSTYKYETDEESWAFPIGTLVKLNDKWTFRAGAAFVRTETTDKGRNTSVSGSQTVTTTYDAAGNVVSQAAADGYVIDAAGTFVPYDPSTSTTTSSYKYSTTVDRTYYRLGLGYLMTENVNLDLMFLGETGDVDTTALYASITYAF